MRFRYFLWAIAVGLAAAGILLAVKSLLPPPAIPSVVMSAGPTVTQLESLEQLVVKKIYISDVLVGVDEGFRGSWLIRGDALISVDFSKARIDRDDKRQSATILLPPPRILTARVDHERTRTWDVKRYSWLPWRGDQDQLRDEVMREAQRLVEHAAGSKEFMDDAKGHAALVVEKVYSLVGWSVNVQWESANGPAEPAK
jgi:Protein of unknown function (DUF4230)